MTVAEIENATIRRLVVIVTTPPLVVLVVLIESLRAALTFIAHDRRRAKREWLNAMNSLVRSTRTAWTGRKKRPRVDGFTLRR